MFGRPGNGAPTGDYNIANIIIMIMIMMIKLVAGDVRKKKFTEHQLDLGMKRSQSMFALDTGLDDDDVSSISMMPLLKKNILNSLLSSLLSLLSAHHHHGMIMG